MVYPTNSLSFLIASSLLLERVTCTPFPSNDLASSSHLVPRDETSTPRRVRSIIIALSVSFGVLIIVYLSYRCCCAPRQHGRRCAAHPKQCNAKLAGHESCGQPSRAHACSCGAEDFNRKLQNPNCVLKDVEAEEEVGRGRDDVEMQPQTPVQDQSTLQTQVGVAPPPYSPPVTTYEMDGHRAPHTAVLRRRDDEIEDGVADGRQPSVAAGISMGKTWGR